MLCDIWFSFSDILNKKELFFSLVHHWLSCNFPFLQYDRITETFLFHQWIGRHFCLRLRQRQMECLHCWIALNYVLINKSHILAVRWRVLCACCCCTEYAIGKCCCYLWNPCSLQHWKRCWTQNESTSATMVMSPWDYCTR